MEGKEEFVQLPAQDREGVPDWKYPGDVLRTSHVGYRPPKPGPVEETGSANALLPCCYFALPRPSPADLAWWRDDGKVTGVEVSHPVWA